MAYDTQKGHSALDHIKKQIAESEGFPVEKIDEFVIFMGDEPYITSSGLQFKMLQTYGVGKFAVQSVMPSQEEYALLRRMMGIKDEEPLVVMRGEVWAEGFDRPFIDYGTATPKNLKGFVRFSDYPLEMATRRATNRAMRLATATGLCSVDEIKTPEIEGGDQSQGGGNGRKTDAPATQGQIDLIRNLCRSPLMTEDERTRLNQQLQDGIGKHQAAELIDRIKSSLDARKSGKAHAAAQATTTLPDEGQSPFGDEPDASKRTSDEQSDPERDGNEAALQEAYADFLSRCAKAKEMLGDEKFQAILGNYGVQMLEQIKPTETIKIEGILGALRKAAIEQKTAYAREEELKALAEKNFVTLTALGKECDKRYGTKRLDALTESQTIEMREWIESRPTAKKPTA